MSASPELRSVALEVRSKIVSCRSSIASNKNSSVLHKLSICNKVQMLARSPLGKPKSIRYLLPCAFFLLDLPPDRSPP